MDFCTRRSPTHGDYWLLKQDGPRLSDLDFAGDIALFGFTEETLRNQTTALVNEAARIGIWVNATKKQDSA